ncbi:hypothetical protein [Mesorhizobium loti]|uniref:hypothetical protein n=1 Tax=Rhizobium loti TaxID=381 RepID=UPI0012BD7D72|nr:hypothetical protein [Mesorhizobium loti]
MGKIGAFLLLYGPAIQIYLTTVFGACGMYVFSSYKGFDNSINFLKRMFPERSDVFYARADFFLVSLSGSVIGIITFSPQGIYQALAAGFGWTGAMNVLLKSEPPKRQE